MQSGSDNTGFSLAARAARQSRWFIGELIVIIAGVLMALGIDRWQESLDDAVLEKQYLAQLLSDLEYTERKLADERSENAEYEQAGKELLAAFEDRDRIDLADVRKLLSEIRNLAGAVPQVATAESMVSAGELGIVGDPAIRAHVAHYLVFARDWWLLPLNQRVERHRELCLKVRVIAQRYGISPSHWSGHVKSNAGPDGGVDVDAFFNDPEAYAYLAALVENREIMASYYAASLAAETRQLRESIEAYLLQSSLGT